jgi:hypothetical protein
MSSKELSEHVKNSEQTGNLDLGVGDGLLMKGVWEEF